MGYCYGTLKVQRRKMTNMACLREFCISHNQAARSLGLGSSALSGPLQHRLDCLRHLAFKLIGEVVQDAHAIF